MPTRANDEERDQTQIDFNSIGVHSQMHAQQYFAAYATFVCKSWSRSHRNDQAISRVTITLLIGRTLSYGASDRQDRRVYAYDCPRAIR